MTSREIIAALKADGWILADVSGSHHQFAHPRKPGRVTVPHPKKDVPIGNEKRIEKQAGLRFR